MVRIIVPGKIPSTVLRFKCKNCGCVFDANKNEYKIREQYNYYYCKCPCCGKNAYEDEEG